MVHNDQSCTYDYRKQRQAIKQNCWRNEKLYITSLKKAIIAHSAESRKEWLVWLMGRAGKKNGNNREWQLWQQNNHPLEIYDESMFYQNLTYIHRNPVEAGFVENEEDYLYSSARDFYNKKGLIKLNYLV